MHPHDLHEYLESAFDYPVNHGTVLEQIGNVAIEAPDESDSQTINDILATDNDEIYETVDDLFESIFGNLDDDYIGRKFYDDRGANLEDLEGDYPHDEQDESF